MQLIFILEARYIYSLPKKNSSQNALKIASGRRLLNNIVRRCMHITKTHVMEKKFNCKINLEFDQFDTEHFMKFETRMFLSLMIHERMKWPRRWFKTI